MLILHTFENVFDENLRYCQFAQTGPDPWEAASLGGDGSYTIREYLYELADEAEVENDEPDENDAAPCRMWRDELAEITDFTQFLKLCEEFVMTHFDGTSPQHVCMTHFGEWTHDALTLVPPTLREQVADVWGTADDFPKSDWQYEVCNGDSHIGYWEWVENQREANAEL